MTDTRIAIVTGGAQGTGKDCQRYSGGPDNPGTGVGGLWI